MYQKINEHIVRNISAYKAILFNKLNNFYLKLYIRPYYDNFDKYDV